MLQVSVKTSKTLCPAEGFHEFEPAACSTNFIRCQRSFTGRIEGTMYQCPEGFAYWNISRKCERTEKILDCEGSEVLRTRWQIPIERSNISYRRRKSAYLEH